MELQIPPSSPNNVTCLLHPDGGYGGLIKSTITSKVDYVVVGAECGWSKIQKMHLLNSERNLRIRLLSNADFLQLKERY